MLLIKGTPFDRIFTTAAKCADDDVRDVLQKGGFVYLTYSYSAEAPFVLPLANLADETSSNGLKCKTIYPVMITRPSPGDPRTDFVPIDEQGLITIIMDHGFEAFVNSDSYYQDGSTYPNIAAGDALKIVNNTATSDRPKLVVDNSGAGAFTTTVAYALSPVNTDASEVRILWL